MGNLSSARVLALSFLLVAAPASAQADAPQDAPLEGKPPRTTDAALVEDDHDTRVQFSVAYEHLSNGFSPWRSASLALQAKGPRGGMVSVAVQETTRFSRLDHDVAAGLQGRLGSSLMVAAEAQVSPTHHALAIWGAGGRVEFDAGDGWGVHASLHHRRYTSTSANLGVMTVERYLARYRVAYSMYAGRLRGSETAFSHRVHGDVYFGRSSSSLGISLSAGEELENVQPIGVLSTQVRTAAVLGRQWLTSHWFVTYDASIHQQGALYTRRRSSVSLGHRF